MIPLFYLMLIMPVLIAWLVILIIIKVYLGPRRRKKILIAAAKVFTHEDVLSTILKQQVTDKDAYHKLASLIERHVDEFLTIRLIKEMPYLSMLMGDKSLAMMKNIFMRELETLFPEVMSRYIEDALEQERLEAFASKKVAAMINTQFQVIFKPIEKALTTYAIIIGLVISAFQILTFYLFNNF